MRLFAISDLHLSLSTNKSMDVFPGWDNYVERIRKNWQSIVSEDDTVIIAGDISWATTLDEGFEDFKFINSLNGRKILIKGNHDFWWSTASKIKKFFKENCFDTIDILHNNCYFDGEIAVCGSRGWVYDGTGEKDIKVINRECGRLERSIASALGKGGEPIVFLHYPPVFGDYVSEEIITVLKKYKISKVYYGHIHGNSAYKALPEYDGISFKILSADQVDFTPILIRKCGKFE